MSLKEGDDDLRAWHIECENCAHCVDLHASSDDDPQNLSDARSSMYQQIVQWLIEDAKDKDRHDLKQYYEMLERTNQLEFIQ